MWRSPVKILFASALVSSALIPVSPSSNAQSALDLARSSSVQNPSQVQLAQARPLTYWKICHYHQRQWNGPNPGWFRSAIVRTTSVRPNRYIRCTGLYSNWRQAVWAACSYIRRRGPRNWSQYVAPNAYQSVGSSFSC